MAHRLWEEVARQLRQRIEDDNEWPDDAFLPTETQLAEHYEVSRDTIRQALQHLHTQGLLTARSGRGRQVRRYRRLEWWPADFERQGIRRDTEGSPYDAWTADVAEQGRTPRQDVEIGLIPAPRHIAKLLKVDAGDTIARRARTRFVDNTPWQTGDSHYPMWLVEKGPILLQPGDVVVPGGLMAHLGHAQSYFDDHMIVRMPSLEERKRLELGDGTPVMEHLRVGYDVDNNPVRVIVTIAPGDRHVIRYRVDAQ